MRHLAILCGTAVLIAALVGHSRVPQVARARAPSPSIQSHRPIEPHTRIRLHPATSPGAPERADACYRRAERRYASGDFEDAERECQAALSLKPDHAAAQALLSEIRFVLGRGSTAVTEPFRIATGCPLILELDDRFSAAVRAAASGHAEDARRMFETVIEYCKWLPEPDAVVHRLRAGSWLVYLR